MSPLRCDAKDRAYSFGVLTQSVMACWRVEVDAGPELGEGQGVSHMGGVR